MLIRSQDKLVIIPLNDFTITVDTEEYADNRERNICVCKSESIFGKVLKGYAEMVKESLVFQMPEDSEVEV